MYRQPEGLLNALAYCGDCVALMAKRMKTGKRGWAVCESRQICQEQFLSLSIFLQQMIDTKMSDLENEGQDHEVQQSQ